MTAAHCSLCTQALGLLRSCGQRQDIAGSAVAAREIKGLSKTQE